MYIKNWQIDVSYVTVPNHISSAPKRKYHEHTALVKHLHNHTDKLHNNHADKQPLTYSDVSKRSTYPEHVKITDARAVIFPESKDSAGYQPLPPSISKEFAQEFHKSVLQTTRQQQEHKGNNSVACFKYFFEPAIMVK